MICIHHNSSAISIQDSDRLSIPITSDRPSKNNQSAIAYPSHKQRSPLKKSTKQRSPIHPINSDRPAKKINHPAITRFTILVEFQTLTWNGRNKYRIQEKSWFDQELMGLLGYLSKQILI